MLHDQHLKIATDFSIAFADASAGGLFPTSTVDLKTASRLLGGGRGGLSFFLECTESCVASAGSPYFSFLVVVSDANNLLTNTVVLSQTMVFGSTLSLAGALPKLGDRYEHALCQGHLGGQPIAAGGSGVTPGSALATFGRRYLGLVYLNSPRTLVSGGTANHMHSAGKFNIWLGAGSESGGLIYPAGFTVK